MDRPLWTIVFITWAHLCRACEVSQSPSLLVALSRHWSTIHCTAQISPPTTDQRIMTSIFRDEELVDWRENVLTNITWKRTTSFRVLANVSGAYRCRLKCGATTTYSQEWTYIHVRDSGYQEPAGTADRLQSGLIAFFILLLLLSISGTYLVLPFHRIKQLSSVPAAPQATPTPTTQQPEEETSGSLYTSLQPRSDDVYDVLDEDVAKKTNVKLQAEVHGVPGQSPMKRPKPQAKPSPAQEKPKTIPDKPPIKQKPKKVTAENSVYENIKR
ncbi:NFAT activation molecule 1 [Lithobates pipiens]